MHSFSSLQLNVSLLETHWFCWQTNTGSSSSSGQLLYFLQRSRNLSLTSWNINAVIILRNAPLIFTLQSSLGFSHQVSSTSSLSATGQTVSWTLEHPCHRGDDPFLLTSTQSWVQWLGLDKHHSKHEDQSPAYIKQHWMQSSLVLKIFVLARYRLSRWLHWQTQNVTIRRVCNWTGSCLHPSNLTLPDQKLDLGLTFCPLQETLDKT